MASSRVLLGSMALVLLAMAVLLPAESAAESNAFLEGYVTDKDSGKPFEGVLVEVFDVSSPDQAVASTETDKRGYYNMSVTPGNYNIYVRVGRSNPTQSVYVQAGQIQAVDFKISMKIISDEQLTGSSMFWIQVFIAVLVLAIILFDQLFFKKKRILRDLEAERDRLEGELKKERGEGEDIMGGLRKDKSQLEYMINLTRTKYHKRVINEESFREIIRDYQEKLIEIEAKIAALEAEGEGGR